MRSKRDATDHRVPPHSRPCTALVKINATRYEPEAEFRE